MRVHRGVNTRARGLAVALASIVAIGSFVTAAAPSGAAALANASKAKAVKNLGSVPSGPVAQPANAEHCTQRSAHHPHDEWARCIGVSASIASVPAVGGDAVVHVTVRADVNRPTLGLQLEVPAAMQIVDPGGATVKAAAPSPDGSGAVRTASVASPLAAGAAHKYTFRVHAGAAGVMHIVATAKARVSANRTDAASDDFYVTVGNTAASSKLGAPAGVAKVGSTAPVPAGTPLAPPPASGRNDAAPIAPLTVNDDTHAPDLSAPAGQSCAIGGWFYFDQGNVRHASMNQTVQAWDQDSFSGDDLLAAGVIGSDGRYRLCFNNDDGDLGSATQEVYVKFISANSVFRVRDTAAANNNYVFQTGVVSVCDTCENEFGNNAPGDTTLDRGMHAFDGMNALWRFVHGANGCFDPNDATCKQMILNWTNTSTDGTFYNPPTDDIHLAADDPNYSVVTVHESSHALMDDVYEEAMPPHPSCNPHSIVGVTSEGCAWVEGYAEWLPAEVFNDPFFRWPDGSFQNLETPTYGTFGWGNGDAVEGRVAGAMIDLTDSTNEAYWDLGGEGFSPQFTTFLNQVSNTFSEFLLTDRPAQGFPVTDSPVLSAAFQNTINYGFRDPLITRAEVIRPTPNPAQNYGLNTAHGFWSVVAIRPPSGADYDLNVYEDHGLSTLAGSSAAGSNAVDYVAIDSNSGRRAQPDDYYPQARVFNGNGGEYTAEFVDGTTTVSDGTHSVFFTPTDVIQTEDTLMSPGVPTYFRIVPAGGQDLSMHLMRSVAGTASTYVQGRTSNVQSADLGAAGGEESFAYTESASQFDAIIVVNKSGSGTYTMYRDTTAPGASTVIGAGNPASTNFRQVDLQLSASDANTGIKDMRVAVDGVLDTEPFEPYTATKTVTLPAGDGTKTVVVQYRNNALMTTTASDTITLDTRANYKISVVSNPPATGASGTVFTASDSTKNFGGQNAAPSTRTNYYLSLNNTKDASDILLGGRTVPPLASKATNSGSASVTVPASTPGGQYALLACADETNVVTEYSETDNCRASATTINITTPDYRVTSVSNPPATAVRGTVMSITETVTNGGSAASVSSTNKYYLSLNGVVDAGDYLLPPTRTVPALAAGGTSTGTKNLTVPATVVHGLYHVIACADFNNTVTESNEANNCRASAGLVTIQVPDYIETVVSNPPASRARGTTFSVNETTKNKGNLATTVNSLTRYYLSADSTLDAGDRLLGGSRTVGPLAAGATSAGAKTLTVPASMPVGSYHVLACADYSNVISEDSETNNCKASAATMNVT